MVVTIDTISRLSGREKTRIVAARGGGMADSPDEGDALREVSRVLGAMDAPYALVGGVAVGIRSGVPRATLEYGHRGTIDDRAFRCGSIVDRREVFAAG
jgi:hypothetical protein